MAGRMSQHAVRLCAKITTKLTNKLSSLLLRKHNAGSRDCRLQLGLLQELHKDKKKSGQAETIRELHGNADINTHTRNTPPASMLSRTFCSIPVFFYFKKEGKKIAFEGLAVESFGLWRGEGA
jgi:hypothetical protein